MALLWPGDYESKYGFVLVKGLRYVNVIRKDMAAEKAKVSAGEQLAFRSFLFFFVAAIFAGLLISFFRCSLAGHRASQG